ncbi:hypothetical protein AB1Y20_020818 [Prymnesium parvum]|uniref:Uncharacterized protein n=1 Tax=Prymnesium parvum TaxID=97485 RepID=A0AB34JV30_PRYPA
MAAEWAALLQARHHSPRLCEVNARSPRAASLLALWPHASYLGLSFNHTASTAWRLPPRAAIAAGDRHRTVLLLDTDDPRPARGRNLLLDDLPNALQRVARRQHTLVVEGAACARGGPRRAAQGWCGAWEELVSRGLVRPLRCGGGASGGERAAWCAGEVALGSACERRAPLLEGGGGAEGWAAEEVRLDLRGKSWRYFSVFECGESAASEEVCLIFKDHVFEAWVGGWQSQDGLAFEGKPALVMPVTWPHARMTHNMALLRDGRGYVIVGGQYKIASAARCGKRAGHFVPCAKDLPPYNGVWMSRGASWRFAAAGRRNIRATAPLQSIVDFGHGTPSQWSRPQFLFKRMLAVGCDIKWRDGIIVDFVEHKRMLAVGCDMEWRDGIIVGFVEHRRMLAVGCDIKWRDGIIVDFVEHRRMLAVGCDIKWRDGIIVDFVEHKRMLAVGCDMEWRDGIIVDFVEHRRMLAVGCDIKWRDGIIVDFVEHKRMLAVGCDMEWRDGIIVGFVEHRRMLAVGCDIKWRDGIIVDFVEHKRMLAVGCDMEWRDGIIVDFVEHRRMLAVGCDIKWRDGIIVDFVEHKRMLAVGCDMEWRDGIIVGFVEHRRMLAVGCDIKWRDGIIVDFVEHKRMLAVGCDMEWRDGIIVDFVEHRRMLAVGCDIKWRDGIIVDFVEHKRMLAVGCDMEWRDGIIVDFVEHRRMLAVGCDIKWRDGIIVDFVEHKRMLAVGCDMEWRDGIIVGFVEHRRMLAVGCDIKWRDGIIVDFVEHKRMLAVGCDMEWRDGIIVDFVEHRRMLAVGCDIKWRDGIIVDFVEHKRMLAVGCDMEWRDGIIVGFVEHKRMLAVGCDIKWRDCRARSGTHPGCVERRIRYFASLARLGECEFDGRLSLVRLRGTLLLYARANPAAHGQRFVQVAASTDEGASWSAFSLISLAGYRYPQGDLYFFSVQPNPAANGSLLALFPIVHKFRGCVGMAVSEDGVRWSAITPLLRCAVHGERTVHHPVAGVLRRGDAAHVYIHHNVPGVTADVSPSSRAKAEFPYLDLPPTKLVRYTIPLKALHSWTMESMMSLKR